jgi:hypothetical protein
VNALCVHCKEEIGEVVSREPSSSGGIVVTLVCEACEETWNVVF